MTLASMTGFARIESALDGFLWIWEIRSVNGRSLDVRCRLPGGYEALDGFARQALGRRLKRGNVAVSLAVDDAAAKGRLAVNEKMLAQVLDLAAHLEQRLPTASPPRIDGLLGLKGILDLEMPALDAAVATARIAALQASFERAADDLAVMRRAEGDHLAAVILTHLAEIERLALAARGGAAAQPAAIRQRLERQVAELLPEIALDPARLAQEAALLVIRADIREELDRLIAHVAASRALLQGEEAAGRRLDFLCQELNREANTLCAKAADLDLTRIGIALKAAIEQLREQVQNIE